MGMNFSLLAVKADVAQLVDAFGHAFPTDEPAAHADVSGMDALWKWMDANKRFVSSKDWSLANPGIDTYGFWQDGAWAVLFDPGSVRSVDGDALTAFSQRFGLALSFTIGTAGGVAFFSAYEGGVRIRHLSSMDGEVESEGRRLPEERRLRPDAFYMEEMERLLAAFGIRPPYDLPDDAPVQGRAYIDRTDYTPARRERKVQAKGAEAANGASRPWWRFW